MRERLIHRWFRLWLERRAYERTLRASEIVLRRELEKPAPDVRGPRKTAQTVAASASPEVE